MTEYMTTLTILLGVVTLICIKISLAYGYWRRRGVVQPPVVFGFGHLLDAVLMKLNSGLIYQKIYRNYPEKDAVGVYGFFTPKLLVRSPELIKRVMVSDFSSFHDNEFYVLEKHDPYFYNDPFILKGDKWKVARGKLSATMTSGKMKEIFPLMTEIIPRFDAYLEDHQGMDIEAKEMAVLFNMDNVSNIVFGISSNCFSDPEAKFRKMGDILGDQIEVWWKTMIIVLMPRVRDFLGYKFLPTAVSNFVESMVHEVVTHRRKNNVRRNDLFQHFMDKETGSDLKEINIYGMTFFMEGIETSAMVASMALYQLALNPDIQRTLYEEVKAACMDNTGFDYNVVNNLPYLEKIIQECQRMYPVVYTFNRECTKSTSIKLEGNTVNIEHGTPVIVPVYAVHHDPLYYPDPEKFDPERFSEENQAARPPFTYMPFGEGPRMCPGMKFGMAQVKLLAANLVYKYKILRSERTPQKLTLKAGAFMVIPNEEMWIRIEKRK